MKLSITSFIGGIAASEVSRVASRARAFRAIPLMLACLSGSAFGAPTDISACFYSGPEPEVVVLENDEVFVVHLPDGARAAVQFSEFTLEGGAYRWRFRKSSGSGIQSGTGRVVEDFAQIPLAEDHSLVLLRDGSDNLYVTAGGIRFIWSAKDRNSAFVYYCSDLAKAYVKSGAEFDSLP